MVIIDTNILVTPMSHVSGGFPEILFGHVQRKLLPMSSWSLVAGLVITLKINVEFLFLESIFVTF